MIEVRGSSAHKSKRPTSIDVARLAGVSQTTVSLVLNNKDTARIAPETEQRVREAAAQLMYFPNELVRSIRKGRTGIVGVYAQDRGWTMRNTYWSEVVGCLHQAASERDVELLLFSHHANGTREKLLKRMLSGMLDGVVVQPAAEDTVIQDLVKSELPFVCIGDRVAGVPSIGIENTESLDRMIEHLAEKGHRSLAMLNFPNGDFGSQGERQRAYLASAKRRGLTAGPESMVNTNLDGIPDSVQTVLAMDSRPTALVCVNDEYAYYAVRACLDAGVDVPGRLAITGFDGIPFPLVPLEVTSMRSPIGTMCGLALDVLSDLIEGREPRCVETLLPTELIRGATT